MGLITLKDLCAELGISAQTARNWIRLGKIKPSRVDGRKILFTEANFARIKEEQDHGNIYNRARKNKYLTGLNYTTAYLSNSKKNSMVIQMMASMVQSLAEPLSMDEAAWILAESALRQMFHINLLEFSEEREEKAIRASSGYTPSGFLLEWIRGVVSAGAYDGLIRDLVGDPGRAEPFIMKNPRLFMADSWYEEGTDVLGAIWLCLMNLGTEKNRQIFYMPERIARRQVDNLFPEDPAPGQTLLDCSCSTGTFLTKLPRTFALENVYGIDPDELCVKLARINLAMRFRPESADVLYRNIRTGEFLLEKEERKYDYIIGNPPRGYRYPNSVVKELKKDYITAQGKAEADSSDIYLEKGLRSLVKGGVLSFALPLSVMYVKRHLPIRRIILRCASFRSLEYIGSVFQGIQSPSVVAELVYTGEPLTTVGTRVVREDEEYTIHIERNITEEAFRFDTSDEEMKVLDRIRNFPGTRFLENHAEFAIGIVTGDNEKYLQNRPGPGLEPVMRGLDVRKFKILRPLVFMQYEGNHFQQAAAERFYRAPEKLVYRFVGGRLVFALDQDSRLSLNSCNILIPDLPGLDIRYIMAVLNSETVQFWYSRRFRSMKVLRSQLEQIPIPDATPEQQRPIIELAEKLMIEERHEERKRLFESVDRMVAALYGLDETEYNYVKGKRKEKNDYL